MYHFVYTNYYLFNVNYTNFNKTHSLVPEIKFKLSIFESQLQVPEIGYPLYCHQLIK